MRVGFVGLGNMGSAMASNLLKAGHEVTVYNRSPEKARALEKEGAKVAATLFDACLGDAVFSMLSDDLAVESVALADEGIVNSLPQGGIHISCSTISIKLSETLTEAHEKRGQHLISAPVFGRPEAAQAKKLFVLAAGKSAEIAKIRSLLDAIGQKTFVISEIPHHANLVKLSGNFLIASVIESMGEAVALIQKGGVDPQLYLEVMTSTLFDAPVYKTYGGLIVNQKFSPAGFKSPLGKKDIGLALEAAEKLHVPLPIASLLRDRLLTLIAQGGEDLDWSAISKISAQEAGLSLKGNF